MVGHIHNLLKQPILYLRNKLSDKHFFIFASILVGLSSGLAAIALKYFVHWIAWMVTFTTSNYEEFPVFAFFPLIGILLTVWYTRFFLKDPLKRGSAEISYTIIKKSSVVPQEDMYAHLVTSGLTIGFGGSLGLESPMVSTGAAIGSNFAQTYGLSYRDRTILLACGASAGIAAAFNAPIAGVLFAVEVLLADVSASAFIPLIISAASGALLSAIILKEGITLTFSLQQPFNYHNVPFYMILGILAGFVSLFYARVFGRIEKRISVIKNPWIKVVGGGIILLVLILFFPPLFGEGYETIKLLAEMNSAPLIASSLLRGWMSSETHILIFLGALIFLKAIAAAVTLGSGGNGGSFAPSLFIGAYLGFVFARLVNIFGLSQVPESNFTIVAMAGILSGVFYAPLTAIFLIAELTGGYDLMIPLMIVASLSIVVTRLFEPLSPEAKKLSKKLNVTLENRDKLLLSRLELSSLIETNFSPVGPEENLKALVKVIASSNRNIFPVINNQQKLEGLIYLDKVRQVIFDVEQYEKITARELMVAPFAIVDINENLHEALVKFDSTSQWNLPVVDGGKYIGFLSKSTILTRYRNELLESA
jgi:CIC family chloride channel protein